MRRVNSVKRVNVVRPQGQSYDAPSLGRLSTSRQCYIQVKIIAFRCGPNSPLGTYVKNVEAERTTSTPAASTWEWIGNVASSAWCSDRLFAWILLIAALIVGLHLRFFRLTRWDLSGDEGASWAAASAPSLHEVVETEQRLDPGKLAIYDIILHEWIGIFGDSVFAMRILSVGIGIVS